VTGKKTADNVVAIPIKVPLQCPECAPPARARAIAAHPTCRLASAPKRLCRRTRTKPTAPSRPSLVSATWPSDAPEKWQV